MEVLIFGVVCGAFFLGMGYMLYSIGYTLGTLNERYKIDEQRRAKKCQND